MTRGARNTWTCWDNRDVAETPIFSQQGLAVLWHGFYQRHSKSAEKFLATNLKEHFHADVSSYLLFSLHWKTKVKNSCGSYSNTINCFRSQNTWPSSKFETPTRPVIQYSFHIVTSKTLASILLDGEVTTGSSARLCIIVIVETKKGLLLDDRPIGDKNALCRYIRYFASRWSKMALPILPNLKCFYG